jgi:septal ring factor EnvC (AmiA/AmiB activator)
MPDTPEQPQTTAVRGYPGRNSLDAASNRFRRALARLAREGRTDPETAAKLPPILAEAVETLDRLAAAASKAEGESARNRKAIAAQEARLARLERKLGRQRGAA